MGPDLVSTLRRADLERLRTRLDGRRSLLRVGDEEAAAFELFLRGVDFRGPCGGEATYVSRVASPPSVSQ